MLFNFDLDSAAYQARNNAKGFIPATVIRHDDGGVLEIVLDENDAYATGIKERVNISRYQLDRVRAYGQHNVSASVRYGNIRFQYN